MLRRFEAERYDLLKSDSVRIANHRIGHNRLGEFMVWIERSDRGERFSSQFTVDGETYPVRKEVYTEKCFILRETATDSYWFLDRNDCGYWLHNDTFLGAETFNGEESPRIQKWLADAAGSDAQASAELKATATSTVAT
jgi:hypothetical protein